MTPSTSDSDDRAAGLRAALAEVRARIARACAASGRDPAEVTLIAITKTYPATDVAVLHSLGVSDVGENKDQEARAKRAELDELTGGGDDMTRLRWHLVGQVQTNKARSVAEYAHAVHSVDRERLVNALARAAAQRRSTPLDVFVQVSLDGDPERGGVGADGLFAVADAVAAQPSLTLRGVMTVPPAHARAETSFARLAQLSEQLCARHPGADAISAGMSADLESAVAHGSTHVRIGTALLGRRPPVFS